MSTFDVLRWVKGRQTGSAARKLMLFALAEHCDTHWECWPSDELLAEICECSPRSIQTHRKALQDDGLIYASRERMPNGQMSGYRYRLAPPENFSFGEIGHRKITTKPPENFSGGPPENDRIATGKSAQPPETDDKTTGKLFPVYREQPKEQPIDSSLRSESAAAVVRARLFEVAGPGLGEPSKQGGLLTTAHLIGKWIDAGADLETDLVPIVQRMTAKARASPIATWSYFDDAVREQIAAKLSPLAPIEAAQSQPSQRNWTESHEAHQRKPTRLEEQFAGIDRVADLFRRTGDTGSDYSGGETIDGQLSTEISGERPNTDDGVHPDRGRTLRHR